MYTSTPIRSATPILPEKRFAPDAERMQQHADLAWLCRRTPIPLALLAHRTRTTTANARSIHHAQAPIDFSTPLMSRERLPCWAPQRSIGLESKILTSEATGLPGGTHLWRSITGGRSGVWLRRGKSRGKLGCANWGSQQLMPQFEPQIPDPLRDQLPAPLSPGRMTAPPIRILLDIFVC